MRKFSARWWSGPQLMQWKMMAECGDYPHHFFQWPHYFGPIAESAEELRTGYPVGETGWYIPQAARINVYDANL